MMKKILFIAILGFSMNSYAQKNLTKKADAQLKNGNFLEAIDEYKKVYGKAKGPVQKGEITYKIAECYNYIAETKDAKEHYQRAKDLKYDRKKPDVLLKLAQNQMEMGDYNEAQANLKTYLNDNPNDKVAKSALEACTKTKAWIAEPTKYKVANQSAINTDNYDWALAPFDKKGKEFIFSSSREGATGNATDNIIGENYTDIWMTQIDNNGKWGEPTPLAEPINTENNEGAAIMNSKGTTLYFTRCPVGKKHEEHGCDIYYADIQGKTWKEPILLKLKDSAHHTAGHPALDRSEKILVFASDRQGGKGGKDLWYVEYDKRAKEWGEPKNLGPDINTPGDEMFPYIADDGTLYFSSNGHLGLGGLDMFKAEKTGDMSWGKVENLKVPLNSSEDDYGITFTKGKGVSEGYFTSNREGGKGKDDIYAFSLPAIELKLTCLVRDKESGKPIPGAAINLVGSDGSNIKVLTDEKGEFTFDKKGDSRYIKKDVNYNIAVQKEDYLIGKDQRSTVGVKESKHYYHEFDILYAKKEISMPEVRYVFDQATFINTPEFSSHDSLMFLYNTLTENPTIVVELQAHTDCRGGDAYNQELSQRRAQACVDFLVTKGIPRERMVAKGYGKARPRPGLECATIEAMPTEAEREAAHQKNRRTTFTVLSFDYKP